MAGELGHIQIPLDGLLEPGQPPPLCNCGNVGDAESVASLTGIVKNLLPYWLSREPDHPLAAMPLKDAARAVRGLAEDGDSLALGVFEQQAKALGRLFTIACNFTDPHAYFVGGGVVETKETFRAWFLAKVAEFTELRSEQRKVATVELIPHLDMAGARGAAVAALAVAARQPADS
jgi:predicted NBD/HSP70 family sugar kinase